MDTQNIFISFMHSSGKKTKIIFRKIKFPFKFFHVLGVNKYYLYSKKLQKIYFLYVKYIIHAQMN